LNDLNGWNGAQRWNVWNDWNGSLPTVNSEFSSQKIWLFCDLSKYAGHFACGVLTRRRPKGSIAASRIRACGADLLRRFEIDDELEFDRLVEGNIGWFDDVEKLSI